MIGAGGSFDSPNEPAWQVHTGNLPLKFHLPADIEKPVDLSRDAGPKRVRYHLRKPEHEKYLKGPWRIRIIKLVSSAS